MPKTLFHRPAWPAHRDAVASRDRRILMADDPLQDVEIDASVGHPRQGGVRLAEAD